MSADTMQKPRNPWKAALLIQTKISFRSAVACKPTVSGTALFCSVTRTTRRRLRQAVEFRGRPIARFTDRVGFARLVVYLNPFFA